MLDAPNNAPARRRVVTRSRGIRLDLRWPPWNPGGAMPSHPIQEQFGQKVIEAFADFARAELDDVATLEANSFSHVADAPLRTELAQVFYGARWLYKLGLALLTRDEERAAHVRAQIVDYAAVCEALLSYSISHALRGGYIRGSAYKWADPDYQKKSINWNLANPDPALIKRPMWWLIRVARDFRIVTATLQAELDWLREQRNTVHLRARAALGPTAFLNQSKRAFETTTASMLQTKRWRAAHP